MTRVRSKRATYSCCIKKERLKMKCVVSRRRRYKELKIEKNLKFFSLVSIFPLLWLIVSLLLWEILEKIHFSSFFFIIRVLMRFHMFEHVLMCAFWHDENYFVQLRPMINDFLRVSERIAVFPALKLVVILLKGSFLHVINLMINWCWI
jgi:hypothetical protein